MRSFLIRVVIASLAVTGLIFAGQSPAAADTVCQRTDPATGQCLIWVEVPGTPASPVSRKPPDDGPKGARGAPTCYWDPTSQGLANLPTGPVPCTSQYGVWSNVYNCYIRVLDPQPPAADPAWQGRRPGDGAIYQCYQPRTGIETRVWSQAAPSAVGTRPTPADVAQIATRTMRLSAINIGITPEPGPGSIGLVGMPVWMWVDNPDGSTFGPTTASASAGRITVTATARVRRITWSMGDGAKVVCRTRGTPYQPSFGRRWSPDCGHVYSTSSADQPNGKYTVTATSDWVVTWAGAGQTGTIALNGLSRSVEISIGEAQVLVQ